MLEPASKAPLDCKQKKGIMRVKLSVISVFIIALISGVSTAQAVEAPLLTETKKYKKLTIKKRVNKCLAPIRTHYRSIYEIPTYYRERERDRWRVRYIKTMFSGNDCGKFVYWAFRYHYTSRLGAWMCIHRHEGSWRDTGDPYWGGLQMDWSFMRSYGASLLYRKGPASNWTWWQQVMVAEKAYRSGRGFYPWPNTARACGLI